MLKLAVDVYEGVLFGISEAPNSIVMLVLSVFLVEIWGNMRVTTL